MNKRLALILVFGSIMTAVTMLIAIPIAITFSQVGEPDKKAVAGSIVGGTLSVGAFALVFLGYSLAERREHFGGKSERVHAKVAMIMYLLVPLSIFDALTSTAYLLVSSSSLKNCYSWFFGVSLGLLFVIGGVLILGTTYVVAEELRF